MRFGWRVRSRCLSTTWRTTRWSTTRNASRTRAWERDLFDLAREIGPREDAQILLSAQMLGPEWALLRLYGIDSEVLSGTSEILCPTDQNRRP